MAKTFAILSTSPEGKVARRFLEAAKDLGIEAVIWSFDDIQEIARQDLGNIIVLPRIAPHLNDLVAGLRVLQDKGAHIINGLDSWDIARDKLKTYDLLKEAQVPTPDTMEYIPGLHRFEDYAAKLGTPFVFKPLHGTHGNGIVLVDSADGMPKDAGLVQAYIDESSGKDIRIIVAGGRYIAAMARTAQPGEFRANLHLGAEATAYEPDEAMQRTALLAAKRLGLDTAGVDILLGKDGPLVIEVNASPGLWIEGITGINVAGGILNAFKS